MKQQLMIWPTIVLTALFLPKSTLLSGNAFTLGSTTNSKVMLNANPLLNNQPIDDALFSMASKGVLTVVSSNPETTQIEKIPFRIYLLRSGSIVKNGASTPKCSVIEVNIAPVLAVAKPDDYLVIEPVRASDSSARRTIKLKPFFNSDLFNIFIFRKNKEGC